MKVRVETNARKERLEEVAAGSTRVTVRERPEGSAANRRVVELVTRHFSVPTKAVSVINGHRGPSKLLEIRGL